MNHQSASLTSIKYSYLPSKNSMMGSKIISLSAWMLLRSACPTFPVPLTWNRHESWFQFAPRKLLLNDFQKWFHFYSTIFKDHVTSIALKKSSQITWDSFLLISLIDDWMLGSKFLANVPANWSKTWLSRFWSSFRMSDVSPG